MDQHDDFECHSRTDEVFHKIYSTELPCREEDLNAFIQKAEYTCRNKSNPRFPPHGFAENDSCDPDNKVFDQMNIAAELVY